MHDLKPPKTARPSRDQMRGRIVAKADELFRHYGFGKTTVADIALELGMSTANVYKFFPSKDAIIEATGERNLKSMKEAFSKAVHSRKSSLSRIEDVALAVFRSHQEIFRTEKQIYRLVLTASENNWACFQDFHASLRQVITEIVGDGMRRGEFRMDDAASTAQLLLDCLTPSLNPVLLRDAILQMSESKVRAHVRFLGRALQS